MLIFYVKKIWRKQSKKDSKKSLSVANSLQGEKNNDMIEIG